MILDTIVEKRREDLQRSKGAIPERLLRKIIATLPATRDFAGALRRPGEVAVIAEIKRASPIKGVLRADLDHRALAQTYEESGAAAISVLTEERHFQGSMNDLRQVRGLTTVPVLRKDFIVDPYQVLEARAGHADAVLLIVAVLDQYELNSLLATAESIGLTVLVEVHTPAEAERALSAEATIIGVNNRNLEDFRVDLETTERLMGYLPAGCTVVSESGIRTVDDVRRVRDWGVNAILVGEALVTSDNAGRDLAALVTAGRASDD